MIAGTWSLLQVVAIATVFVDRDGVLNRKARGHRYVLSVDDVVLLPGVSDALALLSGSGRRVFVVTNQRAVARGLLTAEGLERIHAALADQLRSKGAHVDGIYTCTHEIGMCTCRKPMPGLLQLAQRDHPEIEFDRSVVVGDSADDVRAGESVACRTILVGGRRRRAAELAQLVQSAGRTPTASADSLLHATEKYILKW